MLQMSRKLYNCSDKTFVCAVGVWYVQSAVINSSSFNESDKIIYSGKLRCTKNINVLS